MICRVAGCSIAPIVLFLCAADALAQPGYSWRSAGVNVGIEDTTLALTTWDADGPGPAPPQLVAAGPFTSAGGVPVNHIARWDPSGGDVAGAWESFAGGMSSAGGGAGLPTVRALANWDPDGAGPEPARLVAAGVFTSAGGVSASNIARWDPGANAGAGGWLPFGAGINHIVEALTTWDPDGPGPGQAQLVAAGYFTIAGGLTANRVARWDPAAAGGAGAWLPFGTGMTNASAVVHALTTWDPDGPGPAPAQLIAGGDFASAGGVTVNNIARWDPAAAGGAGAWLPFSTGMNAIVFALTTWDPDGPGPTLPQPVAAGRFTIAGGAAANRIAQWDPAGAGGAGSWNAFATGMTADVLELMTADIDGPGPLAPQLVASGSFTTAGGVAVNHITAWNGSAWTTLGGGMSGGVFAMTAWDPDGAGSGGAQLVAGGFYASAGGVRVNNIARWDPGAAAGAGAWLGFGGDGRALSAAVLALTTWDVDAAGPLAPGLVAGGAFATAGGVTVNNIARWRPALGAAEGSWIPFGSGMNGPVLALTTWDPDGFGPEPRALVAGGAFTTAGGVTVNAIARWDASAGAGAGAWLPFGTGMAGVNPSVSSLTTLDPDNVGPRPPYLIAGGFFTTAGGVTVNHIARWDPGSAGGAGAWLPFATGMAAGDEEPGVFSLTTLQVEGADPQLIAGGFFDTAGGVTVRNIARWEPGVGEGGVWRPIGAGFVQADYSFVFALTTWDPDASGPAPTQLIAGGRFDVASGVPTSHVGRWDPAAAGGAGAWRALGAGVNDDVSALTTWDPDGPGPALAEPVAGGRFTTTGGASVNRIARWDPTAAGGAGAWLPFATGMSGGPRFSSVFALSRWDPDGPGSAPEQLAAAGSFTTASGVPSAHLAIWGDREFFAQAPACPWDVNADGVVNAADLSVLLGSWGPAVGAPADFNSDGAVNAADLGALLGAWGVCPS